MQLYRPASMPLALPAYFPSRRGNPGTQGWERGTRRMTIQQRAACTSLLSRLLLYSATFASRGARPCVIREMTGNS